jgi:hypothetical protein
VNFDAGSILVGTLVSSVGFVLLVYGKKQSRIPQMVSGLLMVVYPFFIGSWLLSLGIFVLLCGALYGAIRLGW